MNESHYFYYSIQPGITVLIINMAKTIFNLSIMNDMNKQMREEYHLTPKDGNIQSDVVLLNGTPLMLTRSLDIPLLKPVLVSSSSPIKVDPQSIVFVQLKGFNAPACV